MAFTLAIKKRDTKEKLVGIRAEGFVPAVFYGAKEKSTPISIKKPEFLKVWREAGESAIVILKGDGLEVESLIHDVMRHPVTGAPLHADFYVFEKGKKIKVEIPVAFVGVSAAVKDLGGTLVKVVHELEVEALPKDLPRKIEIDISTLKEFSSVIHAKDIKLSEGVTLVGHADEIVASVAEPRKIEEEVVAAPIDLTAIEVEKKGKEPKEGEAGAEGGAAEPAKAEKKEKK